MPGKRRGRGQVDKFHRIFDRRGRGRGGGLDEATKIYGGGGRERGKMKTGADEKRARSRWGSHITGREITSTEGNLCNGLINPLPPLLSQLLREKTLLPPPPPPPNNEVAL